VLLVVVGSFFIDTQTYSSATLPSYTGFSASVLLLVFAFTGFEMAAIPAGEALDPRRHLPFALLTGTVIAVLLYVGIQAVCIGTLPELAKSQRPLADAGTRLFGRPGAAVISLGALISIMGTMNAITLAAPRLLFAMAEQGQLPRIVSATHRRFHTPHVAILISAVGMLALTLSGTFASAATLSTIIRLITYAVTCAALPALRRRSDRGQALFVVPAGEIVSIVALILIVWLFSSSSWPEAYQALLAGGFGLLLYLVCAGRGRRTRYEAVE
jgi:amino acid transporter